LKKKKLICILFNSLILSSLISRGLDLNPSHVINYDTPININNYLHQVGRTARATNIGTAYTFVDYTKIKIFNEYIKKIDHSISPLYFPQYKEFMDELNVINLT
jgi:superfamily II DNA/RNA helicase